MDKSYRYAASHVPYYRDKAQSHLLDLVADRLSFSVKEDVRSSLDQSQLLSFALYFEVHADTYTVDNRD